MEKIIAEISALLGKPAGLPRACPTNAYWQHNPHHLARVQSPVLPDTADFVIIGSGMTGVAAAKALLEANDESKVVVLEARSICSGATGRNGGHLKSSAVLEFEMNTNRFGREQARKIVEYQNRTCARVREVATQHCLEESEIRDVKSIGVFEDPEMIPHALSSIRAYKSSMGGSGMDYETVDAKELDIHGAEGAISSSAGAMWPYRLVTLVWQALLETHPQRLNLEALTPATAIKYAQSNLSEAYLLICTPRGTIRTRRVLHCTNGYASNLVPGLAGKIFPVRGTMTVQQPPPGVPNMGSARSWAFLRRPVYNHKTNLFNPGLEYLTQNGKSGLFFFGGEESTFEDSFNDDDTIITESSKAYLHKKLGPSFGVDEMPLVAAWSGIMGFTSDGVPLIGKLPPSLTSTTGDEGQFIAAGFNGYGMPTCWLAGEAIAQLALGGQMPEHVPESYIVTEERVQRLTAGTAAAGMLGGVIIRNAP